MVEIIIVMIIMAIIAAWGIPQFGRALNRAKARNAINNLNVIYSSNLIYQARHGGANFDCAAGNCSNCTITLINDMNGTNSMNIVEGGVSYCCNGATCTATLLNQFTVTATLTSALSANNPGCVNADDLNNKVCP